MANIVRGIKKHKQYLLSLISEGRMRQYVNSQAISQAIV